MPLDVLSMLWVYAMQNKVSDINIQAHDTLKNLSLRAQQVVHYKALLILLPAVLVRWQNA